MRSVTGIETSIGRLTGAAEAEPEPAAVPPIEFDCRPEASGSAEDLGQRWPG